MGEKEKVLKDKILEALKNVEDVVIPSDYDNHSFQEFGIDIVFDYPDAFGQMRKYGIQIKAEDIDSNVIQKVLGQLSVAFGHKFSLDPDKYLDGVFVVTNGKLTNLEYLKSANVGFRNVFWIDSSKLTPFLTKTSQTAKFQKTITKET